MERILISLLIFLLVIFGIGLSWIITCGIVKLISLCFGFAFTWPLATGIWLALGLIGGFIAKN